MKSKQDWVFVYLRVDTDDIWQQRISKKNKLTKGIIDVISQLKEDQKLHNTQPETTQRN